MNLHLQGDVMIRPPSPYYPLLFPPFIFFNYYIRRQPVFTDIHILPSPVRTGKQTTPGKLGVAMGNQLSYSPRVSCSSPGRKMTTEFESFPNYTPRRPGQVSYPKL
ncbi:hypothetical protein ATANTOWER_026427 [Ataeniobius toweri]|uniref:Uncharacterized protein n=1 Tax=Ataeniobius toweri TaxID=208326 RepID=A0ABU7A2W9_9TELE|nr:hypothetical protein [Ataeniobius toweri]